MFSSLFAKIFLSILLGAAIGLERESANRGKGSIGGIRSYALISLLGSIAGIFIINNYLSLGLLTIAGYLVLMISSFIVESSNTKDFGITSELSGVITFLLGLVLILDVISLQVSITMFVLLLFILSLKSKTSQLVSDITQQELQSFISYGIIALVVMPLLPDYGYQLKDLPFLMDMLPSMNVDVSKFNDVEFINPRKVWFVVVLITGIDVIGYILGRIIGANKGFALTSFFAGFVSSTSATQSLAQRSKETGVVYPLVGAALLSNLASFIQIFMLVGPLNPRWMMQVAPGVIFMIATAGILAIFMFKKNEKMDSDTNIAQKEVKIFALKPALKFATLLIFVKFATKICLVLFGQSGFLLSSIIASFAALDPILVNLAEMAGKSITDKFAYITLLTVNASNLMSKSVYSLLQGGKKFAMMFFFSAICIIGASLVWLFFL